MAVVATLLCLVAYFVGYKFYSGYLAAHVFSLDDARIVPSHGFADGIDFVPTNRYVLFGHHYASITGLSPMLGPAIAVIWGWVPGLLWVTLGALLIGCVHDFSALVLSVRARGLSVGAIAEGIIGARAKTMFHLIIFFGIGLAMGVFVSVIADLFQPAAFPKSIFPSAALMVMAVIVGAGVQSGRLAVMPAATAAFFATLGCVYFAASSDALTVNWANRDGWCLLLLVYAFLASVLPVWLLLQPRDFINSLLLYLGVGLMYAGFFVLRPEFASPAFVAAPEGAPPIFPFVFIVIACGAVSGFHGLVSSGTTAKQIANESDARMIGYGGMIGESLLGLMAVLACTAGFADPAKWNAFYSSWGAAGSLAGRIGVFINGGARFTSTLGVPFELAQALIAVVVVSFALTTLDSATRLLRYNIAEMSQTLGFKSENRYLTSALAVAVIGFFAFYRVEGKPVGLALWSLFGTTNQMIAGLTLVLVSLYLYQRGRNYWVAAIPTAIMVVTSAVALVTNLRRFAVGGQWMLFWVGLILLLLAVGVVIEASRAIGRVRREGVRDDLDVFARG